MKTKKYIPVIVLVVFMVVLVSCVFFDQGINAQNQDQDSIRKPDIHISVNKKTDEKGNITEYDSTYSYSYSSNSNNDKIIDSLMQKFHSDFGFFDENNVVPRSNQDLFFKSPFRNDTSFGQFQNIDKMMKTQMEAMMREQDKMMKMFFNDDFFSHEPVLKVPDGVAPKENNQDVKPKNENYKPVVEL
jgi:hypothetical protein